MDHHVKEYYRQFSDEAPNGNFHLVINLHESPDITWKSLSEISPDFPRGWFELAHLDAKDRIEFSRDYWLSKLPYTPDFDLFISRFFASLDDIGIFLTQKKFADPYEAHLVYSIKDNSGFFRGWAPINDQNQLEVQKLFRDFIIPSDYLSFLQIHDGFCKATDCTGIIRSSEVTASYENLQKIMQQNYPLLTSKGTTVDPKSLFPFYESFGMPFYQCFWGEWYPGQEMGNVYYSGEANTISDIYSGNTSSEIMAFSTFTEWLMFYLERID